LKIVGLFEIGDIRIPLVDCKWIDDCFEYVFDGWTPRRSPFIAEHIFEPYFDTEDIHTIPQSAFEGGYSFQYSQWRYMVRRPDNSLLKATGCEGGFIVADTLWVPPRSDRRCRLQLRFVGEPVLTYTSGTPSMFDDWPQKSQPQHLARSAWDHIWYNPDIRHARKVAERFPSYWWVQSFRPEVVLPF